jgi:hypothetical protein
MATQASSKEICCPEFNPAKWDTSPIEWHNERFIKASYPAFLHIPLPGVVGKTITNLMTIAEEEQLALENDYLLLSSDPSPWKGEYYLRVKKASHKAENTSLTGQFETKVFEGPYHHVPKFMTAMDKELADKGKKALKYYFFYTTCPKCAKKYGHNYIVAFAQTN